jgi:hypothetical protein
LNDYSCKNWCNDNVFHEVYTIIHHLETKRKTFESQSIQLDLIRFFSSTKLQITCCLLARIYEKLPSLNIYKSKWNFIYGTSHKCNNDHYCKKIIRPRPIFVPLNKVCEIIWYVKQ